MSENKSITVQVVINAPVEKVWQCWTGPEHITKWCQASEDWHAPYADNDVREGGRFKTTMAAKDGSAGFDFSGTYTAVTPNEHLAYLMDGDDKRNITIQFESNGDTTTITETFDMENENPEEMQRAGWQSILDNFKKHVEAEV